MLTTFPALNADSDQPEASSLMAMDGSVAFLGAFMDAGAEARTSFADRKVLERVRGLADRGDPPAIMVNHELSAVLFHRRGADRQP